MKGFDAFAGVIKSGGKTRRAAKMVILNVGHPDIVEFINSKANEEKKAWVLLDNGYGGGVDGEAYSSIFFQNANHSVRVTDEFMQAVVNDGEWKNARDHDRRSGGYLQGARHDAHDCRFGLHLRRSRNAVRHDGESLAYVEEHRADQCIESVLGVHVPG